MGCDAHNEVLLDMSVNDGLVRNNIPPRKAGVGKNIYSKAGASYRLTESTEIPAVIPRFQIFLSWTLA